LQAGTPAIFLRPEVTKTIVKGAIGIGAICIFLNVNSQNFLSFLAFLAVSFGFVGAYMALKHSTLYVIDPNGIEIKGFLRAPRTVKYSDIKDISVSQGMLARRFGCGTLYLDLRHNRGHVKIFGGGSAEALKDVRDPEILRSSIARKLSSPSEENSDLT
jgi:Bacterial PH domain